MKNDIKLPATGGETHIDSATDRSTLSDAAALRRRLLRAGLSVAPVMLALKSQSVLAADICIKPSAFSSLKAANWKLSHVHNPAAYSCFSHGYWRTHDHPLPYNVKEKSYFLTPLPPGAPSGSVSAGFSTNPGGAYTLRTLQMVLELNGNATKTEAFARHIVGTFLTAVAYPTNALLTQAECISIWDSQGNWSPVAGATWSMDDWLDYFDYIYGIFVPPV